MPRFDRFDICEAWFVFAHDYGYYRVSARLREMGFAMSRMRWRYSHLSENARAIYDRLRERLEPE